MACITIRNLPDEIKEGLRIRAALHRRSMEQEVREILRHITQETATPRNIAAAVRARLASADRADLEYPKREPVKAQPIFSEDQR